MGRKKKHRDISCLWPRVWEERRNSWDINCRWRRVLEERRNSWDISCRWPRVWEEEERVRITAVGGQEYGKTKEIAGIHAVGRDST
jgi:hypothetical protein